MAPPRWDRVLVLQTSFLGDTVLILPLLAAVKRRHPATHLALFCGPSGKQIAQSSAAVDEIIVDDKNGEHRGLAGLKRQARMLRDRKFTLALTPHKSLRSALLLYLAAIPCRIGFRQSKGWFLFHRRPRRDAARHEIERNFALLQAAGESQEDFFTDEGPLLTPQPALPARPEIRRDEHRLLLGVNPGSVWPTKRWSPRGFADLIRLARRRWDCDIAVFGGAEDRRLATEIVSSSGVPCANFAGELSLVDLPAALRCCDVFITNDSGPMHIAVACGVPTVALFCATTPELGFYPYSGNAVVLQKQLHCRPCGSHGGRRCPLGTEDCIRLISPDAVVDAVSRLLKDRASRPVVASGHRPEFLTV